MRSLRRKRSALLVCALLLLLVGAFGWGGYITLRRDRLNAALIQAVRVEDLHAAQSCLDRGADPNVRDDRGKPKSIWEHFANLLRSIRGKPADLPPTALMLAVAERREDVAVLLLDRGAYINARDGNGRTALSIVDASYADLKKALLTRGADPNVKASWGEPALTGAIWMQQDEVVQMMLDKGADPNTKDSQGTAAVLIAIRNRVGRYGVKIVRALLAKGANVNVHDENGRTPLMSALDMGDSGLIGMILARNPDVNARDKQGRTALMMAAETHNYDAVKALLDRGADPNVKNQFGVTALKWAEGDGDTELVHLLEQAGAKE